MPDYPINTEAALALIEAAAEQQAKPLPWVLTNWWLIQRKNPTPTTENA